MEGSTRIQAQRFHNALTVLLAVMLPLSKKLMPLLILVWVISAAFTFRRSHARLGTAPLLALAFYYLLHIGWVYFSSNKEAAYFALEVKFSLLLFPLVWLFLPDSDLRQRLNVSLALVWGCIAFVLISVVRSTYLYALSGDAGVFYYSRLAWFFHPTYLATYEAFALVVLGRLHVKGLHTLGRPWLHHVAAGLLIAHAVLLASKAGYLCVLLALAMVAVLQWRKGHSMKSLVYLASGIALFAATWALAPSDQNRLGEVVRSGEVIGEAFEKEGIQAEHVVSSSGGRLAAWKSAWILMKRHPLGVGTGDVTDALKEVYREQNYGYNYRLAMNAHNQFLQAGVAFGWLGLLSLLSIFALGINLALKRRDFVFMSFLLLLFLNMLFESFLEVQSGVVFVAFFYCFFVKNPFPIRSAKLVK